jgi:hypothetical protein
MHRWLQRIFPALAIVGVAPWLAFAQTSAGLTATVRAERSEFQLGQPAAVVVEVKGCDTKPEVQAPNSEDCTITLAGRLAQPTLLAGLGGKGLRGGAPGALGGKDFLESLRTLQEKLAKDPLFDPDALKGMNDPDLLKQQQQALGALGALKREDYSYVYHVHPKRTGTVTIPPFTVSADGKTTTTKPIDLHVTPTRNQDMVRLALSLSNPRPMVGQEVRLNIDVLVRREQVSLNNQSYPHLPLKDVHLTLPPLDRAGPLELVKPLEEVLKEHAPQPGHHGYKVNHLPYEAVFDKEPAGAKEEPTWYRRRLEVPVRLKGAGKVALSAAGVAGDAWLHAPMGNRRAGGRWQPFVATSAPLDIQVRDLPAQRPPDFRGNIGELKVSASASQTRMPAGTPFTLSVRLEGQGYQPHPGSLDLTTNPEFTRRFRILQDNDRAMSDTLREVTYTLRPLDASVKEVPPISVSYFDSNSDAFKTAKSQAIPLEVTPAPQGNEVKPSDAPPASADSGKEELPPLEDLAAAHRKGIWTRNNLAASALLVAAALVAVVLLGGRLRRAAHQFRLSQASREVARQHRRAAGEVRRQLTSRVQSVHDVRELVQHMLRTRFGMPEGEITPHDAAERLQAAGVEQGLARSCADLLDQCAAAEFAPGVDPVSVPELGARAEQLVSRISGAAPTVPTVSA